MTTIRNNILSAIGVTMALALITGYKIPAYAQPCPPPQQTYNSGGSDSGSSSSGGFDQITYKDNGDGTHSQTITSYDSSGNATSSHTIGNSGPNSNFFDSSGWSK